MRPDEIYDLLPAYCAGSLPDELRAQVGEQILRSPELLAAAMEMTTVGLRLDEVREEIGRAGRFTPEGATIGDQPAS